MPANALPRLLVVCAVVLGAAACTGEANEAASPTPSTSSADGVGSDPGAASTTVPSPTPSPTPSPSPTPTPDPVGTGSARVVAGGAEQDTLVGGDCMVSGAGLPEELEGDVLADDVEVLIGVDNYVGPDGTPVGDSVLVLRVDGEADDARVSLEGGPVAWRWWDGPIGSLELAEPLPVDGVPTVTLALGATLERGPRDQLGGPAPQPSPTQRQNRRGSSGSGSGNQAPSSSPTAAGAAGLAAQPVAGEAQSTSPPAQSPAQVQSLDLQLVLVCTAVP